MNIREATLNYEAWMKKCSAIVDADLRNKHQQMRDDLFCFFRGTYYRWAQLFPEVCPELFHSPKVLATGDLHVGSFGTWRDGEGRLSWGVDDFDEAFPMSYANDLVRLAASAKILIDEGDLKIKLKPACAAILEGYEKTLLSGGRPFVLAEESTYLLTLGIRAIKPAKDFWGKLKHLPAVSGALPKNLKAALEKSLPPKVKYKLVRREAGVGSLGQPRFVAIADWCGGSIAREAKALVPSASVWIAGKVEGGQNYYQKAISGAVRSKDPFQRTVNGWLIRRLSPDSNPIEITDLPRGSDEETLLHAMGTEAANVHLGSEKSVSQVLKDLRKKKPNWIRAAAKDMAQAMEHEWNKYN